MSRRRGIPDEEVAARDPMMAAPERKARTAYIRRSHAEDPALQGPRHVHHVVVQHNTQEPRVPEIGNCGFYLIDSSRPLSGNKKGCFRS